MTLTRLLTRVGAGLFATLPRRRSRAADRLPRSPRVVVPTSMGYGNMILFLPVIAALRRQHADAQVLVLADRSTDAWQALDDTSDDVTLVACDSRDLSARNLARLVRTVRHWKPDVVLLNANTAYDPLWTLVAAASGARYRVGVATGADYHNRYAGALNVQVEIFAGEDELRQNLGLAAAMSLETDGGYERPYVGAAHAAWARERLSGLRALGGPIVGLHLTSSPSQPWKRWAPDKFAALAQLLLERHAARLVLFGGPSDRDAVTPFDVYARNDVLDLVGRTPSMREAAATISEIDLLISGDTGLMHAAAALGTQVLAIYGPTDFTRTLPRQPHVRMISRREPCSPCFYRRTQENPSRCPHRNCLELLEPETVLREIPAMLDLVP